MSLTKRNLDLCITKEKMKIFQEFIQFNFLSTLFTNIKITSKYGKISFFSIRKDFYDINTTALLQVCFVLFFLPLIHTNAVFVLNQIDATYLFFVFISALTITEQSNKWFLQCFRVICSNKCKLLKKTEIKGNLCTK